MIVLLQGAHIHYQIFVLIVLRLLSKRYRDKAKFILISILNENSGNFLEESNIDGL